MQLEHQVTSLELSKKLKEIGVEQESLYDWVEIDDNEWMIMGRIKEEFNKQSEEEKEDVYSAFTVAELGEMLPGNLERNGSWMDVFLEIKKPNYEWMVCYRMGASRPEFKQKAETEADARAKMLIYLIENGLLQTNQ